MPDSQLRLRPRPSSRYDRGAARGWLIVLAVMCFAVQARAQGTYALDQRFGSIEFTVDNLGLFTSKGEFKRFSASLTIDEAHPERTQISVEVDAGSVDMFWEDGIKMLRSPEYFDVQRYPAVHFRSAKVEAIAPDHYLIRGGLEIRGITQPFVLDAKMTDRRKDPVRNLEIANFVVTGALKRSEFGMTADQSFISDTVKLRITAHIQLTPVGHAN